MSIRTLGEAMQLYMATWPPKKQREQMEGQAEAMARTKAKSRLWSDDFVPRLRILVSYHYYRDHDLGELFQKWFTEPYPDVFLDSGAFSAATQGVAIDLNEYCRFIERNHEWINVYANLDVIGDPKATLDNQRAMESVGLNPLPVFHTGEPWEYLDRYIEQYAYIALGGMVPHSQRKKALMRWLIRCFKRARKNGVIKSVYHGFGATQWTVIRDLPWYSVDSSSWGQGFRYGEVPIFDPQRGKFVKLGLGDRRAWLKHSDLVRFYGFDPIDFADRDRNDRAKICAISAMSYMAVEGYLKKRHGEIHIPDRSDEPGVKMHLVTADSSPTAPRGSNMGVRNLAESLDETEQGTGFRAYLVDTQAMSDLRRVDKELHDDE